MKHENFERNKREALALLEWARKPVEIEEKRISVETDAWIKAVAKENAAQAVEDERCVPVIPVDFVIHDEAHPFCDDMKCPCHSGATWDDIFYYNEHLEQPFDDGLLTVAEKHRLWEGRQV